MNESRQKKFSPAFLFSALVCLGLIVGIVGIMKYIRGGRLPTLDRDSFEAAVTQWEDNRLPDYEIEVTVTGRQPGVYRVQVLRGIAVEASMDGRAFTRPRTFGTWSVDGLFSTLQRDLDSNDEKRNLMLCVEFDPTYGFPQRYERLEMQTGIHDSLQWQVTNFQTLAASGLVGGSPDVAAP